MKLSELHNQISEMGDTSKIKKGEIAFHGLLGAVRVVAINGNIVEVVQIKGGKHAKVQLTSLSVEEEALDEDLKSKVDVQLEKGLTRDEALKLAPWKKSYGDCRGFSYNPKTGKATWL